MGTTPRVAGRGHEAAAVSLVATLVLTGFACGGRGALRTAPRDAGAASGAAGGLTGAGGMAGGRLDAALAGVGGSGGSGTGGSSISCGVHLDCVQWHAL
jgi:hypothetical protein